MILNRLFLFLCLQIPLFAEISAVFSHGRILLLHPDLQFYHQGVGSFFRDPLTKEERQQKIEKVRQNLNKIDKEYLAEKDKSTALFHEKRKVLSQKSAALRNNPTAKWEAIQADFKAIETLVQEFRLKGTEAEEEYYRKRQTQIEELYLNKKERNLKLLKLYQEIWTMARETAKAEGFKQVSSDGSSTVIPVTIPELTKEASLYFNFMQIDSTLGDVLYRSPIGVERIEAAHGIKIQEHEVQDLAAVRGLSDYLRSYLKIPAGLPLFGEVKDITPLVLKALYQKHNVPDLGLRTALQTLSEPLN